MHLPDYSQVLFTSGVILFMLGLCKQHLSLFLSLLVTDKYCSLGWIIIPMEVRTSHWMHCSRCCCARLLCDLRHVMTYSLRKSNVNTCLEVYAPLEQPLLPMKLLKNRNYVAISVTACVGTMIYFSMNVLWPQQVAALYTTDETTIGWLSCTTGIGVICGQVLAGIVFKPLGGAKWQLLACCVGMAVFLGGLAAADASHKGLAIAVSSSSSTQTNPY